MVADLVKGEVYLYFFYQFDKPVILNVRDELSHPREAGPLSRLFTEDVRKVAAKRYMQATRSARENNTIGGAWCVLVTISLILLLVIPSAKKGLKFWIPAVIVLGPVALLARFLSRHTENNSTGKTALFETIGNLVPVVVALVVSDVIVIRNLATGSQGQQLQLLFFILPLFTAWGMFHSPMLATAAKRGFGKFLYLSFPHVMVVTFLGVAGIFPVAMPLLNKSLVFSQIIPLSPWIVMT